MQQTLALLSLLLFLLVARPEVAFSKTAGSSGNHLDTRKPGWKAGLARAKITPVTDVWLAGYDYKRSAEGKLHDLWAKILVLEDPDGERSVLISTDHQGMSKTVYQRLYKRIHTRFGFNQANVMLTFSHNHSGPCLEEDLQDYYPSDEHQRKLVYEYGLWMEGEIIKAMDSALKNLQPAQLHKGEGHCTFAVNRRENKEEEVPGLMASGQALKGAVDHSVPVLSIRDSKGKLTGVLFGYACHPTTLNHDFWSGDYPGYAQINIEQKFPGATAMFFNTCGGDQNPLPRFTVERCERYGRMLSDAVIKQLDTPLQPISPRLQTAFEYVNLDFLEVATREKLEPIAMKGDPLRSRWAKRMLKQLDDGVVFPKYYEYPVQAWQLGKELTIIGIGGEAVVDYSLNFKKEFGQGSTWVSGYTNEMAAYIPSRRVWEEGGYEGGSHLDEYGRPAWRWAGDIEYRITGTVRRLVKKVRDR